MIPLIGSLFGGGLSGSGGKSQSGDASTGENSSGGLNQQTNNTTVRIYGGTGNTASAASKQDGTQSASSGGTSPSDSSVLIYVALGIGVLALVLSAAKK